jgi:hypothetical protein
MVRVIGVLVVSILLLSTIFLFRFSPGLPVSSTNKFKTDRHDIADILLKVALNTIKQTSIGFWSRSNSVLFFVFQFISPIL